VGKNSKFLACKRCKCAGAPNSSFLLDSRILFMRYSYTASSESSSRIGSRHRLRVSWCALPKLRVPSIVQSIYQIVLDSSRVLLFKAINCITTIGYIHTILIVVVELDAVENSVKVLFKIQWSQIRAQSGSLGHAPSKIHQTWDAASAKTGLAQPSRRALREANICHFRGLKLP